MEHGQCGVYCHPWRLELLREGQPFAGLNVPAAVAKARATYARLIDVIKQQPEVMEKAINQVQSKRKQKKTPLEVMMDAIKKKTKPELISMLQALGCADVSGTIAELTDRLKVHIERLRL